MKGGERGRERESVGVSVFHIMVVMRVGWDGVLQIVRVPCGGWRRPHACYLHPTQPNHFCLAFLKVKTKRTKRRRSALRTAHDDDDDDDLQGG